jgi:Na+-driven multidrug efflux pump
MDLLFVIVFGWGVAGAAIGTVLAQLVCTVVSGIYMFRKYALFRFSRGEFVFDREKCKTFLRLGIPTTLQQCSISFGQVFIQRLVNSFGPDTMAAYTVGIRIENYTLIPIVSLNMGIATFTGRIRERLYSTG